MPAQKSLKDRLSPLVNIPISVFLIAVFCLAAQNVIETFPVAQMTALNYLKPYPIDYFWQLNIHQAPLDKNKVRYYADYYEHLLDTFPSLRDAYGLLGYCYHYLGDDPKAIKFLKTAIQYDPDYFWNYYNLAIIYIRGAHYRQASDLLQGAVKVDPVKSLKSLFSSQFVYLPLLGEDPSKALAQDSQHLKKTYEMSFILIRILNQAQYRNQLPVLMDRLHLEPYAF